MSKDARKNVVHTPGPWEWDAGDIGIEYSKPYCDVYVDGGDLIIANVNDLFNRTIGHANARLIAAAPELLAALEALVALDDGNKPGLWPFEKEFKQGHAAITKAKA